MTRRQQKIQRCLARTADALLIVLVVYVVWLIFGAVST
jgi:hypothetical protein